MTAYVTRHYAVEAMHWNGQPAEAHDLCAWVWRNRGEASYNGDHINVAETGVLEPDQWLVIHPGAQWNILPDELFQKRYELPAVVSAQ